VFERFTDKARRVVVLAQEEARLLDHNYIGTEHLLLGLIDQGDSVAAATLGRVGVTLEKVRAEVELLVGRGEASESGHIPFSSGAKTVLELAARRDEATPQESPAKPDRRLFPRLRRVARMKDPIRPEHILLGIIEEGGVAVEVLDRVDVDLTELRQGVIDAMRNAHLTDETSRVQLQPLHPEGTVWPTIVQCPGCDEEITLVGSPEQLHLRFESDRADLALRIYVTVGDDPEYMAHECPTETNPS